jgi:hypothetical protein
MLMYGFTTNFIIYLLVNNYTLSASPLSLIRGKLINKLCAKMINCIFSSSSSSSTLSFVKMPIDGGVKK